MTKKCSKCGIVKSLEAFHKCKGKPDGMQPYCKACSNEAGRVWYANNLEQCREKGRLQVRRWQKANPEKVRQTETRWLKKNPTYRSFSSARRRARRNKIPFLITQKDIVIPTHCPVLGIPLKPNIGGGSHTNNSPALDRIVPELGYIPGNVAVISQKANTLKSNASPDQLRAIADWIESKYPTEFEWLL